MKNEAEPIRGKVARILNARELALNIGSRHGVEVDMVFDVLDASAEDVKDPDTGMTIGSIYRPKVRVKVLEVQELICVASTYKSRRVNVGGSGLGVMSSVFAPPRWIREFETLRTEEATWEDLDEKDSYVSSGDPVVQVLIDQKGDPTDS